MFCVCEPGATTALALVRQAVKALYKAKLSAFLALFLFGQIPRSRAEKTMASSVTIRLMRYALTLLALSLLWYGCSSSSPTEPNEVAAAQEEQVQPPETGG